jgi:hypothetical protein
MAGELDGMQEQLAWRVCPQGSSRQQALIALAILTGAAASVSARLTDEIDLGKGIDPALLAVQGDITSLLMETADRATPSELPDRGDGLTLLGAALKHGFERRQWLASEEVSGDE